MLRISLAQPWICYSLLPSDLRGRYGMVGYLTERVSDHLHMRDEVHGSGHHKPADIYNRENTSAFIIRASEKMNGACQ